MAKKKADNIFSYIAKELSGEVLSDSKPVKYFIDTGNLSFNWMLSDKFMGGGIPGGKIIEFYGPEASGKCISEDMEVVLSDGRISTIKDIVDKKEAVSVLTLNEKTQKIELAHVSKFWVNGQKECFEVETRSGRSVTTTRNHLYLTPDGWQYLDKIKDGSFIAVPKESVLDSDIMWDEVKSIKSVGIKNTYDLGVPETHNFIANNCIVHNSYWGANITRGAQALGAIPVYLDCENALNNEFVVKTSHIDLENVVRFDPSSGADTLEGCFSKIYNVIRLIREKDADSPIVFVYDSIAASPCARELREVNISEDYTEAEWKSIVGSKEQPGERAKICSKELRKLGALLEKSNATVLILNQTRIKVGVRYGNPYTTTSGEALKFFASCRVNTAVQKKIENKKLGTSIGINLRVKNVKNRCCAPFREVEGVHLYWADGVDPLSGLLTCLFQAERIDKVGQGTYQVKEPWAGGQEIKFRASKAKNEIEADVLYKCPALIDAKNEQEVRDYLTIFGSAIKQGQSEDNEEVEVKDAAGESDYE